MKTEKVYVKGNPYVPESFWDYALLTEPKHEKKLLNMGYVFSKKETELYSTLSKERKKSVRFDKVLN